MSRYFELMREAERDEAFRAKRVAEPLFPTRDTDGAHSGPRSFARSNQSLAAIATSRWRLISLCMLICILFAALVTAVLPKKYAAEVQFLVKNERQDLTITPTQGTAPSQLSDLNEEEVNSEMHLLLSHDILEGVVRDDSLYMPFVKKGSVAPDRRAIELAVMKLSNNLEVTGIRKTNVIQANYRAGNPDLAANVLNDLTRRYLNAHLEAHSTPGSYGFFSSQLEGYRNSLNNAEMATSAFRRASHIFNPDQQRSALVAQMEDADAKYQDVDAELRERRARLASATAEDNLASKRIPADERTSVNQLTIDHLQTELADMENRRIGMLMKFKPTDRAVLELEGEIANTQRNLASARVEYAAEKTTTVNPLHQTLTAMQSDNRIDIDALQARRSALSAMRKIYLAELNRFDSDAVTLGTLEQTQEIAQQNYMDYSKRFQEARLADQMDKEKFANVVIIEKPVPSPISVSPKLAPNLLLGALLGLIAGFSIAFIQSLNEETSADTNGFTDHPIRQ